MWARLHWPAKALVVAVLVVVGLVASFFLLIPVFEWAEQFLDPGGAVGATS